MKELHLGGTPSGRMIIPSHYLSGSNGPTNTAEAATTKVYDDFERRVDAGMNEYLATGASHLSMLMSLD